AKEAGSDEQCGVECAWPSGAQAYNCCSGTKTHNTKWNPPPAWCHPEGQSGCVDPALGESPEIVAGPTRHLRHSRGLAQSGTDILLQSISGNCLRIGLYL